MYDPLGGVNLSPAPTYTLPLALLLVHSAKYMATLGVLCKSANLTQREDHKGLSVEVEIPLCKQL